MKSLYDLLGVGRKASIEEIRRAYRKLAAKLHPDRHPGDKAKEERFKEISAAYEVLADPVKRARYDAQGRRPPVASGPRPQSRPVPTAEAEAWLRGAQRRSRRGARVDPAFGGGFWWGRPVPIVTNGPVPVQPVPVSNMPGFFVMPIHGFRRF